MNIYLDLDETLIHSISSNWGEPSKRKIVTCGVDANGKKDNYNTCLRPYAHKIIKECKNMGNVILFTNATTKYAQSQNEAWGLGFNTKEIIAREDHIIKIQIAYGQDTIVLKRNVDKNSVIIDNLHPNEKNSRFKIEYLGIPIKNYIQIREFNGHKDPPNFIQEWAEIIKKIKNIQQSLKKEGTLDIDIYQ